MTTHSSPYPPTKRTRTVLPLPKQIERDERLLEEKRKRFQTQIRERVNAAVTSLRTLENNAHAAGLSTMAQEIARARALLAAQVPMLNKPKRVEREIEALPTGTEVESC